MSTRYGRSSASQNESAMPEAPGAVIEYEMPDLYGRPWATIWDRLMAAGVPCGYYFNDLVSNTMLKSLVHKNKAAPRFKPEIKLNERETEVLRLICQEHTAAEIGEKVFLSARTVEGIRANLLEKIGVRNTAGLVMYAVKNGIVE